jgi:hypothetical protein
VSVIASVFAIVALVGAVCGVFGLAEVGTDCGVLAPAHADKTIKLAQLIGINKEIFFIVLLMPMVKQNYYKKLTKLLRLKFH